MNAKKVIIGLSGGVDSAVSAALLLQRGFDVHAVFLKNWSEKLPESTCNWREECADAERIASFLHIPFEVVDYEDTFHREVIAYLVREYASQRTPNPDVLCNKFVKFQALFAVAKRLNAAWVATGHYARIGTYHGAPTLVRGADKEKDQSYFLHQIDPAYIPQLMFPVGELTKFEVRAQARALGLPNASKPDSVGICFVGEVPMGKFLGRYMEMEPGPVQTVSGAPIGTHQGLAQYTIGQRHGFGGGGGAPYFVIDKIPETNTLVVTQNPNDPYLFSHEIIVQNPHQLLTLSKDALVSVQVRYRTPAIPATVTMNEYEWIIKPHEPVRAACPGQFVVLYDGDVCLGGGPIAEVSHFC